MIDWTDVNAMQKQKLDLQVKLNEILKSDNISEDSINELKSEILYLNKKINRILGSNEVKRQEEIKDKKSGKDELNKKRYYEFKEKYNRICNMSIATNHIITIIDRINYVDKNIERVKVKN